MALLTIEVDDNWLGGGFAKRFALDQQVGPMRIHVLRMEGSVIISELLVARLRPIWDKLGVPHGHIPDDDDDDEIDEQSILFQAFECSLGWKLECLIGHAVTDAVAEYVQLMEKVMAGEDLPDKLRWIDPPERLDP